MKISGSPKFDARSTDLGPLLFKWSANHPILVIVLVSLAAIAVNCYPVIFCGRSYVAPAYGLPMVYEKYPTLPGMDKDMEPAVAHGSDVGAALIWGVPVGFIESRSVWEHGEIPLWNRYSHAGDTLIGQAISMIGDPLQWIVIAGHGSSLVWDIKYVMAKLLFCIGFGLLIRRIFGNLPLALLFAGMAAYCGAFYFIFNHTVFFVFSYAPWILLSALELLDLQSRHYLRWGLVWLVANFGCFNGGHVEPAVVLIGGLNLAAAVFALTSARSIGRMPVVFLRLVIGTGLFLALTAPMWLSFLAALQGAWSLHSDVHVTQFAFASLLGIFDDVFFRLPVNGNTFMAPAPGASFLILVGSIYSLVRWRIFKKDIFYWINTGAILLWGGCIFGWVPSGLLSLVPFLNRVGHTHTDFSYLLIIHLTIQCAYGFKSLVTEENFRGAASRLLWVAVIFAGMTVLYCFGFEHGSVPWAYYAAMAAGAFGAPLLFTFLKSRGPIPWVGVLGVAVLAFVPHFRFGLYNFGNQYVLIVPKPRVTLDAPSPAIEEIKADSSQPFRVMGAEAILYGDYAAVYGLEDIRSCAPLSNNEFVSLLHEFPGMSPEPGWDVQLTNLVAAHALLNLLNVKYVLTRPKVNVQDGLGFHLTDKSDLGVLENLDVWPRAFFCNSIVSIASTKKFIQYLLENGKQPFAALTPDEITGYPALTSLRNNSTPSVAPASHYESLPNSTAFDIHADSAGVVCLTEEQGRNFTATANSELKTVLTVNRVFKGVYLDKPGDYHVQFTYRPAHWRLACALFWAAVALIAVFAAADFFGGKFKRDEPLSSSYVPMP
ncbi:MAG TPA: hypothetical protein VH597_08960 [Verrucomicrobiae bacterium]|jgi:hypothetical protein|nr:hypothetical protein [Verrucomicrobiae bacterium]